LLVDPLSAGELAEAMRTLAQDSVARTRCIAAGRARAEQLTWQNTARLTANVYRAVLSQ
jgi:glycosyltransferase involved in cell wall biosynthesis